MPFASQGLKAFAKLKPNIADEKSIIYIRVDIHDICIYVTLGNDDIIHQAVVYI